MSAEQHTSDSTPSQLQLFLLALSFLTRIPVKLNFAVSSQALNQASRYFALVGVILGALLALSFLLLSWLFPAAIAVALVMAFSLIITGALHEDGLADVWDGFGGGWHVADKLSIMKDSRLGTYGAAALVMALLIKYQTLVALSEVTSTVIIALVLGQSLSRVVATSLIADMDYVSQDATSKVKPIAMHLSTQSYQILLATGGAVLAIAWLFFSFTLGQLLILVSVLFVTRLLLKRWFEKQLSGYTGDCLGSAQQVSELVTYLCLVSLL
ncbi:adenosylcobinamide-GDP ribazoletransferase [Pseudoalteromonas shioyasakiensis]|uniref:Adenosylcobinamide-GDP ribazoletransferase n=2 Tax=Pseudoalteromonas shioyasakiensis TaxID=1190813 RepID=A0ABT6TZT7_9GAMM|nr:MULTISPECIES: adenosylcobinamide-GDP ribazoletransferase [Pseudoalteromonas]MDI4669408.1 adenosylcobinamide-GDP ribazoletransferase [Pseudoalteromonas shioyasakiensis]MDI4674228.1 adenosylcobinamide-GDP ribazoletransferase [Pseudoalteromonas shioyasakiensis]NUJ21238.1 adenosylcobinamide-GDP ribazoletransferase [Pseudoalteromonas sp. 0802]NUJ30327.1 adenosylcobinamide-GDP ribazoletransferase [Pseudoalteromonas sp. 2103]NUJ33131.1 adenosylcobinamide-GDP ribazoletransferase [Pseudoalteromonas 